MPDLKQMLTEYVDANTPTLVPPYERVLDRSRARRARRRRLAAGSATAAALAVAAVTVPLLRSGPSVEWLTAQPPGRAHHHGEVELGRATSCAVSYSPRALSRQAAFAFDGTVTGIARHPADPYADTPVRLRVNEWFRGGTARTVVLDLPLPPEPGYGVEEHAPPVTVGTRLLVSGTSQSHEGSLADAQAWSCGFTRYYDPVTATAWRRAMADGR